MVEWLAGRIRALGVRLTAHPMLQVQLAAPDEEGGRQAGPGGWRSTEAWSELWEALDPGGVAVSVVHLGGGGEGRSAS